MVGLIDFEKTWAIVLMGSHWIGSTTTGTTAQRTVDGRTAKLKTGIQVAIELLRLTVKSGASVSGLNWRPSSQCW